MNSWWKHSEKARQSKADMTKYEDYFSSEEIVVTHKDFYTTRKGFPNRKAFVHFSENLEGEYFLVLMNVDLRKANMESYENGDYVLRRFILSLLNYGFYVFHIWGEKFNILVPQERVFELKELLEKPSNDYDLYYGIVMSENYTHDKSQELIQKGISLMYQDKSSKKGSRSSNTPLKNIPEEYRETFRRKFRNTTWYSIIDITVSEPEFQSVKVYVFPTEYKKPLETVKLIVVVDELTGYRLYYGKDIHFGVGGTQFSANGRFNREQIFTLGFFQIGKGKAEYDIYTHKGIGIPTSFGKRANDGREVYPIKQNINGFCDYVLLKDDEVKLNTEGLININRMMYGVYQDDDFIELIIQA